LLGLAFGFVGILLASPFTAVAMILIKMIYVEDVLGEKVMPDRLETETEKADAVAEMAADDNR
jgi:predicted PurR-regulated permease PerM